MMKQRKFGYLLVMLSLVFVFVLSACGSRVTVSPTASSTLTPVTTKTALPAATFKTEPTATPSKTPTPMFAYKLKGLNWGPYTDEGQNPELETVITREQLSAQLEIIAPYTEWVRTFGCQGLSEIVPMAHERGIKVAMGAWLGQDLAANEVETACLIANAIASKPEMVIVGSETLLREDLSPEQLTEYLVRVKAAIPSEILVTTADTSIGFTANEALVSELDVIMVNIYPYWAEVSLNNSIAWLNREYNDVVSHAQGKQVWISETGWPSNSIESASDYLVNFVSWAKVIDVSYFIFEAFDEPWKLSLEKPEEAYWGIWNAEGMKEGMQSVFDGAEIDDNWSPTRTPIPTEKPVVVVVPTIKISGPPAIEIESWPAKGAYGEMTGSVTNVDPSKYMVACYLEVNGGWWTKPTWDDALTPISSYGNWGCYVTTGGIDDQATTLKAYLLPKGVSAPQASGGGEPGLGEFPSSAIYR